MKTFDLFFPVPEYVLSMMHQINSVGKCLIVGGSVRDAMMGHPSKDIDIECYNIDGNMLQEILAHHGEVRTAGKHFGVFKVYFPNAKETIDVSLARRENKIGIGHTSFTVITDPKMTLMEAALRRDYTINCFAYDPFLKKGYDPLVSGINDLNEKRLCYVSTAFIEDPLRVLRGMRFAGQFGFTMDEETANICRVLRDEYATLSLERIWGEWSGMFAKSVLPSAALNVLEETGWMGLYPQVEAMAEIEQDKAWHPEGRVLQHTKHVMNEAVRIANRDNLVGDERVVLLLAALCHDMGKATTTYTREDGRIVSPQHAKAGVEPAAAFMKSIGTPDAIRYQVERLVAEHMVIAGLPKLSDKAVLRLADRVSPSNIDMLVRVIEADESGRPPLPKATVPYELQETARRLSVREAPMQPLIMGRDILALGMGPGKHIGEIIRRSTDAQLEGAFTDREGALVWLKKELTTDGRYGRITEEREGAYVVHDRVANT